MKKLIFITICVLCLMLSTKAQDVCPVGKVCLEQAAANKLFNAVEQAIAAKDALTKLLAERNASDATIAKAMQVIEGWKELDTVNGMIITKHKDVIVLYESVMKIQQSIIESLEKRLAKPRSPWAKFLDALKSVTFVLAGIALGRGI